MTKIALPVAIQCCLCLKFAALLACAATAHNQTARRRVLCDNDMRRHADKTELLIGGRNQVPVVKNATVQYAP